LYYEKYNEEFLNKFEMGDCLLADISDVRCLYYDDLKGYGAYLCTLNFIIDKNGKEIPISETINIQGVSPRLKYDGNYKIEGTIVDYKGRKQLKFAYAEEIMPTTAAGIYRFLSTGMIKHIKQATARNIVYGCKTKKNKFEGFGDKTLEIIELSPEKLTQVKGISETKAAEIHDSFMAKKIYANTVMFLSRFDISPNKIMKVYKIHGLNTLDIIQNKPYSLADSVNGFGFKTCDRISLSMDNFTVHDIERLKTGILYCLEKAQNENGHCFMTKAELISEAILELSLSLPVDDCRRLLNTNASEGDIIINMYNKEYTMDYAALEARYKEVMAMRNKYDKGAKIYIDIITAEEIMTAVEYLLIDGKIIKEGSDENLRYYLKPAYEAEVAAAKSINMLLDSPVQNFNINIDALIDYFCRKNQIELEEMQRKGVEMMFWNNLGILTGNAGSGKTFTVRAIIGVFEMAYKKMGKEFKVSLCSPTGKAAKRLSESTGIEAQTIHRMLGWKGEELNTDHKLDCDLLIVDETSMVDIFLIRSLLAAVDIGRTKVLFIGDDKQLLPVGPGSPFVDMLSHSRVPKTKLNVVKRQAEGSGIIKNANRVIHKEMIETDSINKDFYVIYEEDKEKVASLMLASAQKLVNVMGYSIEDVQLLCPQRTGVIGTNEMNKQMQKLFNPEKPGYPKLIRGFTTFMIGDKVIHSHRNCYNLPHYIEKDNCYVEMGEDYKGVFNGDMGIIVDIIDSNSDNEDETEGKTKIVVVRYDKMLILYDSENIENLELAYALTVHKAQGSQFKAIITCLHYCNYLMLNNNLTYTNITRGEQFVCVIGQEKAIRHAINNIQTFKRNTALEERIIK